MRRYSAAGGVVVCDGRVLVLDRPSKGEVRLPKGHIEKGESSETAAVREVLEESGYRDATVIADLGVQEVSFTYGGETIEREEKYFLMSMDPEGLPYREEGEDEFVPLWTTFDDALQRMSFEAEREWLRRAREVYQSKIDPNVL